MLDKRHRVLYAAAIAVALLSGLFLFAVTRPATVSDTASSTPVAVVATTTIQTAPAAPKPDFRLEVVTDPKAQEQGLGGRADIPQDYGMLFVLPKKQIATFWMKGMLTSIDIIWLSDTGVILGIEEDARPESYASGTVFRSPEPIRYVLETRAGEARRQGWTVGAHVPFTLP